MTIVHILWEGRAMCGMEGLPGDWPPGHKWVALNDAGAADDVSCADCTIAALRGADSPAIPEGVYTKATLGKYDGETAAILQVTEAEAVLLVVKQGNRGDGFSVAVDLRKVAAQKIMADIPRVLRDIADNIERQEREKKGALQ